MNQSPTTTPDADWQLEDAPCDLCGSAEADPVLQCPDRILHRPVTFTLVACRRCGLARVNPRPTADSLAVGYAATYQRPTALAEGFDPPRGLLRWALANYRNYPLGRSAPRPVRALLRPLGALALRGRRGATYLPYPEGGRLLDFGCGHGKFVARMVAAGWHAEGLDLSPDALAVGREAGLTLHHGTLPGADLPEAAFDAVTMWHSLEHVPSPRATLEAAHRLLRPGGLLLVSVPRLDSLPARWTGPAWYGLGLPLHLTQFTRATLLAYLDAIGFRVERFTSVRRTSWLRRSFGWRADDTGSRLCRRLSRSRLVAGALCLAARLTGRTQQMVALARRRDDP